jgi:arginyl-tRNA synthetase
MSIPLNPFAAEAARVVCEALGASDPSQFPVTAVPRRELGDFAVGCFPAAKLLKQPPPALAARVAEAFSPGPLLESAEAAGPFVNFRAHRPALYRHLLGATLGGDDAPALIPPVGRGETICIDYSSPNISKELAYHHIHGTAIGHALYNLYAALGYRAVGINHLGDWGTTHGMLIAAYHRWGAPEPLTVARLNELYVAFRKEAEKDPALVDEARAYFAKLEAGDADARALWQRFRDVSWEEFQSVYDLLGIRFDEVKGESEYEADIPDVLRLLEERELLAESEGALVVPLDDEGMPPLLLKKKDGATLYGTRDLAAARYRHEAYGFSRSLYVVDRGQSLHFQQLFAALKKAGFAWADAMHHVAFGLVRIGGKKTGTRAGSGVKLREVLEEATSRSRERVKAANPELSPEALESIARQVGIGAVVFANLVSQRQKDVDFDWDEILAWEGDSGPYIQYAHARCASILRRAEGLEPRPEAPVEALVHDAEWALALKLVELPDVVQRAASSNEPHLLARYLLDLCAEFSRWYTAGTQDASLRVLCDDRAASEARLALVAATREVLRRGLALLGVAAPDAM